MGGLHLFTYNSVGGTYTIYISRQRSSLALLFIHHATQGHGVWVESHGTLRARRRAIKGYHAYFGAWLLGGITAGDQYYHHNGNRRTRYEVHDGRHARHRVVKTGVVAPLTGTVHFVSDRG